MDVPIFSTQLSLEKFTLITEPMVSVRGTKNSGVPRTPMLGFDSW